MKALFKMLSLNAVTVTLLYFGLNGVAGAYNVYATCIVILALMSFVTYMQTSADEKEKIKARFREAGRTASYYIGMCINLSSALVLIWFGKFFIAACLIVMVLNISIFRAAHNKE